MRTSREREQEIVDQTRELLGQLVRNACVNDGTPQSGQEIRSAETLKAFFADCPPDRLQLARVEPSPGRVTLIATVPGTDTTAEPLTLIGHTDVVPVDNDQWTYPPFDLTEEGGCLYGRGVVDMLHQTAAMAAITRATALAPTPPRGTLTFIAAADEEARATFGMRWIEEHMPGVVDLRNCISESGGSHIHGPDGRDSVVITVGEKGAAQRRLHITGEPGHASVPYGKKSAVDVAAQVVNRIAEASLPTASDDLWAGFLSAFGLDGQTKITDFSVFGDLAAYGHAISRMTIARTGIKAGTAMNVIPSEATVDLDIRTLPGQDDDMVDRVLTQALGDLAPHVRIERLICEDATASPTDTRLYQVMADVLAEQHPGAHILPVLFPGGTDLRMARRQGGVGYGFGSYAKARTLGQVYAELHSHDECLHLEDLELTVRALAEVTRRFLA